MRRVVEGIHPSARAAEGKIEYVARSDLVNYTTTRSDLGNCCVVGGRGIIIVVVGRHSAWTAIVGIVAVSTLALHVAREDHTLGKVDYSLTSATGTGTSKHTAGVGGKGEGTHRAISSFVGADGDALAIGQEMRAGASSEREGADSSDLRGGWHCVLQKVLERSVETIERSEINYKTKSGNNRTESTGNGTEQKI